MSNYEYNWVALADTACRSGTTIERRVLLDKSTGKTIYNETPLLIRPYRCCAVCASKHWQRVTAKRPAVVMH